MRRRPGGSHGGGDLRTNMAALADAGHDHPSGDRTEGFDRPREGFTQPVVERGSKCLEPGFLGLDGANGRGQDFGARKVWQDLLHLARIPLTRLRVHQPHQLISKAADRNLALTTSVYALTRFRQVRNPTHMRNRIKTAQTRLAVGRNGFRISVSAICVLSALSRPHPRHWELRAPRDHPISYAAPLAAASPEASAASTLYGALPAARPGGGISSSGIGDAASTGRREQPARAHLRKI
jgi:hypothetical protein